MVGPASTQEPQNRVFDRLRHMFKKAEDRIRLAQASLGEICRTKSGSTDSQKTVQ